MSCSKVLNFLERLDDRIGCAHEETDTVIKPREDVGGNKSLGCIFTEKSADCRTDQDLLQRPGIFLLTMFAEDLTSCFSHCYFEGCDHHLQPSHVSHVNHH